MPRILCALATLTLCLSALAGDVTIEQKSVVKYGATERVTNMTLYYGKDMYATRMKSPDMHYVTVYRYDKKLIWQIDLKNKTYTETTFEKQIEQLKASMTQMKASIASTKKMLENPDLPEATKKAMRTSLQQMEPKYTVAKGGTAKIAGYDCVEYIISNHGKVSSRMWCTEGLAITNRYNDVFGAHSTMADIYKNLKGIALRTKAGYSSTDTIKVGTDAIDASVFELPAGLTKKAN